MPTQPPDGKVGQQITLALGSRAPRMCQDFPEFVVVGVVGEGEMEKTGIRGSGSR